MFFLLFSASYSGWRKLRDADSPNATHAYLSMANLSHLNFTVLFAFADIPSRVCTHIASVLKPAIGVACPLMCMYKSHTKKCGGNALMIVFPCPADARHHRKRCLFSNTLRAGETSPLGLLCQ